MNPFDEVPADLPAEEDAAPPDPCWRCGLDVDPAIARCPHCAAPLRSRDGGSPRPAPRDAESRALFAVLRGFFGLLVVSIIQAAVLAGMTEQQAKQNEHVLLALFEGIDTLIVLITWAACGATPLPPAVAGRRALTWAVAPPILAALLGLNLLYHAAIREYVKIEWLQLPEPEGVTTATVLLECLQPGVVEELFFRYLLLGVLRRHAGVHGAVLVSAAMFAVCHVHVLLSMPYLFLAGVVFGYARVGSRSLALPVALHFLHNLAVIAWEGGT